jgi:hypothetical protein
LRAAALAKFAGFLAKDTNLSPALKKQYQAAADRVIAGMGPKGLSTWTGNVGSIRFYASIREASAAIKAAGSKEKAATPSAANAQSGKTTLHLNGGGDNPGNPASARATADYYAHEFAHAVDQGGKFSNTQSWKAAWAAEHESISGTIYGREPRNPTRNAAEGFADFGIHAWLYPTAAEKFMPTAWEAWSRLNLV